VTLLAPVRTPRPICRGCGQLPGSRRRPENFKSFNEATYTYWCGRCPNPDTQVELRCRQCPSTSRRRRSDTRDLVSYDPATETFVCSDCCDQERRIEPVDLRCRRCGKQPRRRQRLPERLKHLRSFRWDGETATYLCLRCAGRENVRKARARLVAKDFGVTPSDSAEYRRQAMAAHAEHSMRPRARSKNLELARAALQEHGVSEKGREHVSLGHFVKEQRAGRWCLCPICRKVHYLSPQEKAKGGPGMHNSCYREFTHSETYRDWRRNIGSMRSPHLLLLLKRFPFPVPSAPRGRPPDPEQLDRNFRWTLRRFYFGESWREIAKSENYTHGAVQHGVSDFIERLPPTWLEVFPDPRQSRRLETALPVSQLRAAIAVNL